MSGIKRTIDKTWYEHQQEIQLHWMEQEYFGAMPKEQEKFVESQGTRIRELITQVSELENKIITLETRLDIAKSRIKVSNEVIKEYNEVLESYKKMLGKDGE